MPEELNSKNDIRKDKLCDDLGIKLIRIKESQNTWNDTADKIFYVSKGDFSWGSDDPGKAESLSEEKQDVFLSHKR